MTDLASFSLSDRRAAPHSRAHQYRLTAVSAVIQSAARLERGRTLNNVRGREGGREGRGGRGGEGRGGGGRGGEGRGGEGMGGGRAGQGRAGEGRAGQGRAGQGRAGQGRGGRGCVGRGGEGRGGEGRGGEGTVHTFHKPEPLLPRSLAETCPAHIILHKQG